MPSARNLPFQLQLVTRSISAGNLEIGVCQNSSALLPAGRRMPRTPQPCLEELLCCQPGIC